MALMEGTGRRRRGPIQYQQRRVKTQVLFKGWNVWDDIKHVFFHEM